MNGYMIADGRVKMSVFSGNRAVELNASAVTPELCTMLGSAAGTICAGGRIGLGYTGGSVGEAMKSAFSAGAQSTGAQVLDFGNVMESEAMFALSALGLGLTAYITGGPQCTIRFLGWGGTPADDETIRRIDEILASGSFLRCCWNEYRAPSDINGIKLLYLRELYSAAPAGLAPMCARPVCADKRGEQLFAETLQKLGCDISKGNTYRLSEDGLSLSIEDAVAGVIGPKRVFLLSCGAEFERRNDVVVPYDAPNEVETLAKRYARKVYRSAAGDSAETIARAQYRMRDGILTAIRLMAFMRERNMSLEEMDMLFQG